MKAGRGVVQSYDKDKDLVLRTVERVRFVKNGRVLLEFDVAALGAALQADCDDYCGGSWNPPQAAAPVQPPPLTAGERADLDFLRCHCWSVELSQVGSGYMGQAWQVRYQIRQHRLGSKVAAVTNSLRSEALRQARAQVESALAQATP